MTATETKHTPGPWYAVPTNCGERGDQHPHEIVSHGGVKIGRTYGSNYASAANARLIAAAPALLAACEAFLRAPTVCGGGNGSVTIEVQTYNLDAARAAIAAARGPQQ